jgi:DNA-3-methyladenine glycosylase II
MSFDAAEVERAIKRLTKADPVIGKVIRRVGDFDLKTEKGGYEVLVRSILSQQISIAAAKTIRTRLQALLPSKKIRAEDLHALTDEQLQSVGISQQKRTYLRDLTRCTLDGTICFRRLKRKADDEAIEELIQVKGIGRWTAQMYLMFSLGRLDVFAVGDLGIRNAMISLYGLKEKPAITELEDIARIWAPHRSIASWYLWRALDEKVIGTEYPV